MSEFIRKETVISAVKKSKSIEEAVDSVSAMKPEQVEEIKQAVWFDVSDSPLDPRLSCSSCGAIHIPYPGETRCPYCGAHMVEDILKGMRSHER